jgi:excinuclease ABC subunit B
MEPLIDVMDKSQINIIIDQLFIEMKAAAKDLDFERAAQLRDEISSLKEKL